MRKKVKRGNPKVGEGRGEGEPPSRGRRPRRVLRGPQRFFRQCQMGVDGKGVRFFEMFCVYFVYLLCFCCIICFMFLLFLMFFPMVDLTTVPWTSI